MSSVNITGVHAVPTRRTLSRLLQFVRPHRGKLFAVIVLNVLAAGADVFSFTLLIPFLNALFRLPQLLTGDTMATRFLEKAIGFLIDPANEKQSLLNVIAVMLLAVTVKNFLIWLSGQVGVRLQEYVVRDLRNALYGHLLRLPLPWFTRMKVGQMIARVLNDTGNAKVVVTELITRSLLSGAQVIAALFFMIAASVQLTIAAMVVAPLMIGALQPLLKKLRRGHRRLGNEHGELTSLVQEVVSGVRLVKSYGAEEREEARFVRRNSEYVRGFIRVGRLALLSSPITETLGTFTAVLILWFGAGLVLDDKSMGAAELMAFLLVVMRMLQPLKQLSQVPAAAVQSITSAERIFQVLDATPETVLDRGHITDPHLERELRFESVSFAYETDADALTDVSFTAPKGQVIALVGASGAGKSTLVDLLPRFLEPTRGRITLDGTDLRDIKLSSLRALTGIVSQDTVLFNDTVRANVAFGRTLTDAQLNAAADAANALAFIRELPEGWDTNLGERGARLSGGQRQRLAIARALLVDPPILILDEATSALDAESERLVQEAIDRLFLNRTVFVIAHRLATIQHADRILVLDRGRIVEEGTHAELLARGGTYARLHSLQFDTPRAATPIVDDSELSADAVVGSVDEPVVTGD